MEKVKQNKLIINNPAIIRSTVVAITCMLSLSCKMGDKDESHLPPKVMAQVVKDISLAEAYSTFAKDSLHRGGPKDLDSLAFYYKEIFAHYNITAEQFQQSLDWYKGHATEMDSMYSGIMPIITKMQSAYPAGATKIPLPDRPMPGAMPGRP